jgi:hypothetical protein
MDISQSKVLVSVAASTAYNDTNPVNIKGIRADASGVVEIIDAGGTTHSLNMLQGEVLQVQGKIQLTTNTAVATQVFL